ncbi:hypothetical protein ISF_05369 [Cordyceps fumosorosea ARSEF 2679]|uniref:Uncharacterized protein n=1 Tax=Cordyceps fumosorosea (strain ARSEF 2679) TaxID=1081104 RepID=A0A167V926_CORFA|nr:hypothetical protein ISF_05369 [Cordyceps fumosorosea ARSEF 2679]OAA62360.1 hypothetical protein ISF_05369 [Cordyceps fumosorosea ARSEF 2679]
MDSSPLIKAHDHAQAAAVATRQQSADTTVAINEHTLAAGEFSNAAQRTSSIEALRTLKLLEAHHQRLAELLRLPPDTHPHEGDEKALGEKDGAGGVAAAAADGLTSSAGTSPRSAASTHMPGLAQQRRHVAREMSSSIASNLASARGIRGKYRGQPLSPSVSNDQAPGNVDPHPRRDGSRTKMQTLMDHQPGKPTWVPPTMQAAKSDARHRSASAPQPEQQQDPELNADDAGYTRFYNTFGSIINKISAPLAFAGLPLIQEESVTSEQEVPEPTPSKRRPKTVPSPSAEPDLSKIYSKATMRVLAREGHAPHESFYVVPTTGHTMSYANILSYAEKEKRRLGSSVHSNAEPAIAEEEEDDFVDARELPAVLSPGAKRRVGKSSSSSHTERQLNNTIEELYTENQSLKDMLDKLSKRLHTFEASAQSSAMALAESYRLMRPSSPNATAKPDDGAAAAMVRKSQEMEEQLAAATKQMERLEKDNRKMQKTLEKYREKWELLKAGAKARRDGQKTDVTEDDSQG